MSAFSRLTSLAATLPSTVPFVGPEAIERSRNTPVLARIGANESSFGPSPKVIEAMTVAIHDQWKYADPENYDLKQALALHHAVAAGNIAIGSGVDGLLGEVVRLFIEPGDKVATSFGGYPTFNYHVHGYGGELVTTPYVNDREDLDGLLNLVKTHQPKLVYFANPDNPMGTWWNADDVIAFAKAIPETTLLILDEAYCETAPTEAVPSIQSLIGLPNILRMRTFSKAYGMAGSRVGYAIGTIGNVTAFDKIRNHFGMARVAVAGALAALDDQAYLNDVVARIHASRERIGKIARDNGLSPIPSATNFVAIDCHRDGTYARAIVDGLMDHGVFIRMPGVAPLNRCIRVSCGTDALIDLFEAALPKVLKSLG
jgi:histidinol-phosphate aminotransferase